jgi:hypothetical protein
MRYKIFTQSQLGGVIKPAEMLTPEMAEAVERDRVWRGGCPCCARPLVIRNVDAVLSAGDEHFLLHGGLIQ